jgi:hypothetical protein
MVFPYDAAHGSILAKWQAVADDTNKNSESTMTAQNAKRQMDKLLAEFRSLQSKNYHSGTVTLDITLQHELAPLVEKIALYKEGAVRITGPKCLAI